MPRGGRVLELGSVSGLFSAELRELLDSSAQIVIAEPCAVSRFPHKGVFFFFSFLTQLASVFSLENSEPRDDARRDVRPRATRSSRRPVRPAVK